MKIDIISPQKTLYRGEISSAQFPGEAGAFEVLENHAPLISLLKEGDICLKEKGSPKELQIAIASGVVELNNNMITVLVEE